MSAIDRVADELAIRNALARIAHAADRGDVDAYLALLTPDAVWTMPASPHVGLAASERRGHEEIAAGARERLAAGVQGPGSATMHTVTTTAIEFTGADAAASDSTFVFWTATGTAPVPASVGRYHDEFRRTPDGWKLARRDVEFG